MTWRETDALKAVEHGSSLISMQDLCSVHLELKSMDDSGRQAVAEPEVSFLWFGFLFKNSSKWGRKWHFHNLLLHQKCRAHWFNQDLKKKLRTYFKEVSDRLI